MENFQEFMRNFGPQHFAVGAPLNLVINSLLMWYAVNQMSSTDKRESIVRCAVCAVILYAISTVAIGMLLFPVPFIFILAFLFWLVASVATIQGMFELTYQGGGGVLAMYLFVLLVAHGVAHWFVT